MKRRSLLILSGIALLFASCGNKGGKSGLLVPKDASMVIHINSASLSSKLSWDEIRQTNWFKKASAKATDSLAQQLLADPSRSGIDTKSDFVLYLKKHGRSGYFVLEGSVADPAAFEKMLTAMHKEAPAEVKKEGEISYMGAGGRSAIAWNKTMFAIVNHHDMPDLAGAFMKNRRHDHDEDEDDDDPGVSSDSLNAFAKQALNVKGSDNLDTDSRFADLVKNDGDIHFWMDMGKLYGGMGGGFMSMMKVSALTEGNIVAASVSFDNGKITAKAKNYHSDEMNKILSDNRPKPVSADVINRIPSSDVVGVLALNYSPNALKELLKMIGVDAIADAFLAKINFSIDELIKANKGEILLSLSDLNAATDSMSFGPGHKFPFMKNSAKVLFATSVNDKAAFDKLVTVIWDLSKQFGMSGNDTDTTKKKSGINYKLKDDWFAASNSPEYTDKFLAGGNNKLPFADRISGHPFGLYIDLQKIIRFIGSLQRGERDSSKAALNASLGMWQDITAWGGDYKDKASEMELEVNLVDKNTNSLKQLNQYLDKMVVTMEKSKMAKIKEVTIEDLKEAPPAPSPK